MRAAALSIIPSSTGAAKAIGLVLPELKGKLDGTSLRVPDADRLDHRPRRRSSAARSTVDEINDAFDAAANDESYRGVLEYSDEPLVSADIVGNPASCIFAAARHDGRRASMVKVLGWYDNEWGYSNRLVDLVEFVGEVAGRRSATPWISRSSRTCPLQAGHAGPRRAPTSTCRCATARSTTTCASRAALPTIDWLRERDAVVIVAARTSAGRRARSTRSTRWRRCARRLGELLGVEVALAPEVVGLRVASTGRSASSRGDVMLLENLRFDPGERRTTPRSPRTSPSSATSTSNDAFGAVAPRARVDRRPAAGPAARRRAGCCPRGRGARRACSTTPKRPFVAVLGGAKVSDKLGVIDALLDRCDTLLIGGAMAFTFLARAGHARRRLARASPTRSTQCRAAARRPAGSQIPTDVVIAQDDDGRRRRPARAGAASIPDGWKGLDIGPETAGTYADVDRRARATVLWNGPMGVFELAPFAAGTRTVAEAVADCRGLHRRRRRRQRGGRRASSAWPTASTTCRTGGGASLELIEHGDLPGLASAADEGNRD